MMIRNLAAAGAAVLVLSAVVEADPVTLTNRQMDGVTAGKNHKNDLKLTTDSGVKIKTKVKAPKSKGSGDTYIVTGYYITFGNVAGEDAGDIDAVTGITFGGGSISN